MTIIIDFSLDSNTEGYGISKLLVILQRTKEEMDW